MDIETSGAIQLFFPNPSLQLVYFEAIANSLDAGATNINIDIQISAFDKPDSLKLTIEDNGKGFNNENFSRFRTLLKPRDKYHKGIGRLVFLNYFKRIDIESAFDSKQRNFTFIEGFDGNNTIIETNSSEYKTTMVFSGFQGKQVKSYDDLKPSVLKNNILQHLLPTLIERKSKSKPFCIKINLRTESEQKQKDFFSTNVVLTDIDLPDLTLKRLELAEIDAYSSINMNYSIKTCEGIGSQLFAFNIDGRTIPITLFQDTSIPLGYSIIFIFSSELFIAKANSSRQKLELSEGINKKALFRALRENVSKLLEKYIPEIVTKNKEVKAQFDKSFPHLLGYFDYSSIGLIDRDESLNTAQNKFFKDQKDILLARDCSDAVYEKSLDLSSRALTEYVLYREKIIQRLKAITEDDSEADIHNLIVPRGKKFSSENLQSDLYNNNAWLLDDKFMSFRTILSEYRMDRIIDHIKVDDEKMIDAGRPDIAMIFTADPNESKNVDVVVVEIKKKTDDEKENSYAINQLLDRAVKLVEHCPNIQRVWYYAVLQVSDKLGTRLKQQRWSPLFSKGNMYYQEFITEKPNGEIVPTPTFVVSFDAIVSDAETRNATFLDILRSTMQQHTSSMK